MNEIPPLPKLGGPETVAFNVLMTDGTHTFWGPPDADVLTGTIKIGAGIPIGSTQNALMNLVLPPASSHNEMIMYCDPVSGWIAMRRIGNATIDFGSGMVNGDVKVVVTGQTKVPADAKVECYFMAAATPTNDADAHVIAASLITLCAGSVTPGVGYTIFAHGDGLISGQFQVTHGWR